MNLLGEHSVQHVTLQFLTEVAATRSNLSTALRLIEADGCG
jgi:hypothetical protein